MHSFLVIRFVIDTLLQALSFALREAIHFHLTLSNSQIDENEVPAAMVYVFGLKRKRKRGKFLILNIGLH